VPRTVEPLTCAFGSPWGPHTCEYPAGVSPCVRCRAFALQLARQFEAEVRARRMDRQGYKLHPRTGARLR